MISITDGLRCYYNSNMKEKTPLELEKENRILQFNWNSLREWLEKNIKEKPLLTTYFFECDGKQKSISGVELEELKRVLDKMNELEGVEDENRS